MPRRPALGADIEGRIQDVRSKVGRFQYQSADGPEDLHHEEINQIDRQVDNTHTIPRVF